MPPARSQSAFTILEVLVALLIFTMAAVVLGDTYVNVLTAYQSATRGNQTNRDVRFARLALLAEPDREKVEKGGDFDAGNNRHLTWKATIDPTELPDLFTVTFECDITSPDLKEPEHAKETFRVLRPTWSKDDERAKLRTELRNRITQMQKGPPIL
jgi:general secretion pathway protein I